MALHVLFVSICQLTVILLLIPTVIGQQNDTTTASDTTTVTSQQNESDTTTASNTTTVTASDGPTTTSLLTTEVEQPDGAGSWSGAGPGFVGLSVLDVPDHFYPGGTSIGDTVAPVNDDGSTGSLPISTVFLFYGTMASSLFINTNGAISFDTEVSQYTPDSFPLGDGSRVVAPFWADVDTWPNDGRIYFREIQALDILDQITSDITGTYTSFSSFQVTWALVATWYKVTYFGGSPDTLTNTFQAVLATNGRHSFVIFNYGDINWTTGSASGGTDGLGGIPAQIGLNAGDGTRYYMVETSQTDEVVNIETTSNVDMPGRYMFRVDDEEVHAGGCNTAGTITIKPRYSSILGGKKITISGPCFSHLDFVQATFESSTVPCNVAGENKVCCIAPTNWKTGRISVSLAINGQTNHTGIFTYVPEDASHIVERKGSANWTSANTSRVVVWNPEIFSSDWVNVDFVTFLPGNANITVYTTEIDSNIENDGYYEITSLSNVIEATAGPVGALRISESLIDNSQMAVSVFSDIHISDWFEDMLLSEAIERHLTGSSTVNRIHILQQDVTLRSWNRLSVLPKITAAITELLAQTALSVANILKKVKDVSLGSACSAWNAIEDLLPPDFDDLLIPPCTLDAAINDRRFQPDDACNMGQGCGFHPGAYHCIRSTRGTSSNCAGQQACYSEAGDLLPFHQGGGTVDRAHAWCWNLFPLKVPLISHAFEDVLPYLLCCSWTDNCDTYEQHRPTTTECADPPRPARGMGDPHFFTLDGISYTFNGLGEFIIIKESSTGFELQGRMVRAADSSGNQIQATKWSAFAVSATSSPGIVPRVQVELVSGDLEIRVDGQLEEFGSELPTQSFFDIDISSDDGTTATIFLWRLGITVEIKKEPIGDQLSFLLLMPTSYKGDTTSGLLGIWNDNQADDFTSADGSTVLPADATMQQIHDHFGITWRTSSSSSLFTYMGTSHATYQDTSFTPVFTISNLNNPAAQAVCGDAANIQCYFDLEQTGIEEVAMNTLTVVQETQRIISATQPVPNCGFSITPPVGGVVLYNGIIEGRIAQISCKSGYIFSGDAQRTCLSSGSWSNGHTTCTDINECLVTPSPCGNDHSCTNIPGSYTCVCRDGFYIAQGTNGPCVDQDECLSSPNPCGSGGHTCTNTEGSYNCACRTQYHVIQDGIGPTCYPDEINECELSPPVCGEANTCADKKDFYTCTCQEGYTLQNTLRPTCLDNDECLSDPCGVNSTNQCINTPGAYRCNCTTGYVADVTSSSCIASCASMICDETFMCEVGEDGAKCRKCRADDIAGQCTAESGGGFTHIHGIIIGVVSIVLIGAAFGVLIAIVKCKSSAQVGSIMLSE